MKEGQPILCTVQIKELQTVQYYPLHIDEPPFIVVQEMELDGKKQLSCLRLNPAEIVPDPANKEERLFHRTKLSSEDIEIREIDR
jgi:hypothetical protein